VNGARCGSSNHHGHLQEATAPGPGQLYGLVERVAVAVWMAMAAWIDRIELGTEQSRTTATAEHPVVFLRAISAARSGRPDRGYL